VIPPEFMLPSLRIARTRRLVDEEALEDQIAKMVQLDERQAIARWSQKKEKA
ncbi:hypothetical protein KI387_027268, partial [Taxus chinensis]